MNRTPLNRAQSIPSLLPALSLVSELLEGETLRSQIQRGPVAVRKAIDYGVQIARGLAAAHEKGIVVISYTRNWAYVGLAAAGSWVGTFLSMTLLSRPGKVAGLPGPNQ